jgi:hypothetical protein
MPTEPIDPITATGPVSETASHAAIVAYEEAASAVADPLAVTDPAVTETEIPLAEETITELESQALEGDEAAVRELARRANLNEEHAAGGQNTTIDVPPPIIAHSPPEPGVGIKLDESA